MTIGIYKLNFNNTDKIYIGQSKNIENRFIRHKIAFKRNEAPKKLQEAANIFGLAGYDILLECTTEELDFAEKEAVEIYNSIAKGFNSMPGGSSPNFCGEDNYSARYSNDKYIKVLEFLIQENPSLSKREISELLNVSLYTVRHIAALESHGWLKEVEPEKYAKLENLKKNMPYYTGKQYSKLKSPEGIEYNVIHITNFAKEHSLSQPKISEVLNGKRKSHKGWIRV